MGVIILESKPDYPEAQPKEQKSTTGNHSTIQDKKQNAPNPAKRYPSSGELQFEVNPVQPQLMEKGVEKSLEGSAKKSSEKKDCLSLGKVDVDYTCKTCSESFASKKSLANHLRIHLKEESLSAEFPPEGNVPSDVKAGNLQTKKPVEAKDLVQEVAKDEGKKMSTGNREDI